MRANGWTTTVQKPDVENVVGDEHTRRTPARRKVLDHTLSLVLRPLGVSSFTDAPLTTRSIGRDDTASRASQGDYPIGPSKSSIHGGGENRTTISGQSHLFRKLCGRVRYVSSKVLEDLGEIGEWSRHHLVPIGFLKDPLPFLPASPIFFFVSRDL